MSVVGGSFLVVFLAGLATWVQCQDGPQNCNLPSDVAKDIDNYQEQVNIIIQRALKPKRSAYSELKKLVTKFGPRPSGSKQLEDAIDYMKNMAEKDGFRVRTEEVSVPHWVRGEEYLQMISPHVRTMSILGLGQTVGTQMYPAGTLVTDAVVVSNFKEMEDMGRDKISGKIVVVNGLFGDERDMPFVRYAKSNSYRTESALRAAKLGAAAVLVRSRTDFSLNTPHTGSQQSIPANSSTPVIPAAAVSIEDAELMHALYKQGEKIRLTLRMSAATLPNEISRNLIVEHGPEVGSAGEMLVLSAHLDSWDVGDGAMDNGAGVFVNYHALLALKQLGLKPRRTVRAIFWTAEEEGYYGGEAYMKEHADEMDRVQAAIENDLGTFRPLGLRFNGTQQAHCMVSRMSQLMKTVNATSTEPNAVLSEVHLMLEHNVPALSLDTDQSRYFWYHHTHADTMQALRRDEMQQCVAVMASTAFVLADLPHRLHR